MAGEWWLVAGGCVLSSGGLGGWALGIEITLQLALGFVELGFEVVLALVKDFQDCGVGGGVVDCGEENALRYLELAHAPVGVGHLFDELLFPVRGRLTGIAKLDADTVEAASEGIARAEVFVGIQTHGGFARGTLWTGRLQSVEPVGGYLLECGHDLSQTQVSWERDGILPTGDGAGQISGFDLDIWVGL